MKSKCQVLVIGGSAGSLDVILKILPQLKTDLKPAIIIVLHRKNTNDTILWELIASKTKIPVKEVEDKDIIKPGHIFIAPADYHLLVETNITFSLDYSEKINYSRPSIDATFETAADVYQKAVVGIILSGANADGVAGLKAIKKNKGITIAQHPETAEVPFMPEQAILNSNIDYIFTVDEIIGFINAI